jgi:hypothetical protein
MDLGLASSICSVYYSITSLEQAYRKFNRNLKNRFIIDKTLLSDNTEAIILNVWAVPERNKVSFEFNNPDIHEDLLHKITDCEP